jgi:hypothetical protein
MTPWTSDVMFSYGTQLIFGSLTFATREDRDLKMLPLESALRHLALASSSSSGGSCLGSDPCEGGYIRTAKTVQDISVMTSILRPLARVSSSSSSASIPDSDSSDDYPGIRSSICEKPADGGRLIYMVASNGDRSHNNSSRYPNIRRSEVSDA